MSKYKIVYLLPLLIITLSACTGSLNGRVTEKTAPDSLEKFDESGIKSRINELRDGKKPVEKPSEESSQTNNNKMQQNDQAQKDANANKQVQLENLTNDFNAARINTNLGSITVKFYSAESPITVNNFMNLAKNNFYNGTKFHRVIPQFMIQGGCPNSKDDDWSNDGTGGPGYAFQDEFNSHKLVKGSLAMANSGPNTNGSQFFIVTAESTPWLDGKHTNFGYVTDGMDLVEKIESVETNERDHPMEDISIESVELLNI